MSSCCSGKTFNVNAELKAGNVTETVNVTAAEKQIDLKSVTLAHNVTAEEFDRLPKARSFQCIALTAPVGERRRNRRRLPGERRQRRRELVHRRRRRRPTA